jgi:hypothetical protein
MFCQILTQTVETNLSGRAQLRKHEVEMCDVTQVTARALVFAHPRLRVGPFPARDMHVEASITKSPLRMRGIDPSGRFDRQSHPA